MAPHMFFKLLPLMMLAPGYFQHPQARLHQQLLQGLQQVLWEYLQMDNQLLVGMRQLLLAGQQLQVTP
jgi:hypothetical protein